MGTDKAQIEMGGVSLLARAARAGLDTGLPVLVVGRPQPSDWPFPDVMFLPDEQPGLGPLGGLRTALRHAPGPVLLMACDMPRLSGTALRWLADRGKSAGAHGLATVNGGRLEPLFSLYLPACLPLTEQRLAANALSLHGLIEAGEFAAVDAPEWVAAQLVNINTPGDLAQL